jgi:hypothetical protein
VSDYVSFGDAVVNLSEATTAQIAALWNLYDNHNNRRGRMPLWCTKTHGGQMYLKKVRGRLWAAHYPGQGDASCRALVRHESEGVPHRHMKTYTTRALETAGHTVTQEFSTGKTRLDVAVNAPYRFGIEAQFSPIAERDAKSRTTKSFRAGWPAIWLPGSQGVGDRLGYRVPVLRHNDNEIDWTEGVPAKGTATATNVRRITPERCDTRSYWNHCPHKRGGFCGRRHPWFNDMSEGDWWTLDDALAGIAAGVLVLHQDQCSIVRIVPTADLPLYRELTGLEGTFTPGSTPPQQQPDSGDRECAAVRQTETDALNDITLDLAVKPISQPMRRFPELGEVVCQKCGIVAHHPDSVALGICRGCAYRLHITGGAA